MKIRNGSYSVSNFRKKLNKNNVFTNALVNKTEITQLAGVNTIWLPKTIEKIKNYKKGSPKMFSFVANPFKYRAKGL